jgi:hypothetical protein
LFSLSQGEGADVKAVSRSGQTTLDMANGPVQRVQPYPETVTLLEKHGREEQSPLRQLLTAATAVHEGRSP